MPHFKLPLFMLEPSTSCLEFDLPWSSTMYYSAHSGPQFADIWWGVINCTSFGSLSAIVFIFMPVKFRLGVGWLNQALGTVSHNYALLLLRFI